MTVRKTTCATCVAVIIVSLFVSTGCQSFTKESWSAKKLMFWKKDEIPDGTKARKMVALWSDSVSYGVGQQASRGLGGRLFFYDDQNKTTKIDGDLVVYAYDDEEQGPNSNEKPDRKYVISGEEFQAHYSESDFGPSYSVWIPWDRVGNTQKAVSLVPIFKSKSGQVLVGDHSRSLLPGAKKNLRQLKEKTTTHQLGKRYQQRKQEEIQRVSFDDRNFNVDDYASNAPKSSITKTTIALPRSMQQRVVKNAWRDKDLQNRSRNASGETSYGRSFPSPRMVDRRPVAKPLTRPRPQIYQAPTKPTQSPADDLGPWQPRP